MISLPVLDDYVYRPTYANGPSDLSAVKLLRLSITDRCNLRCIYCMPAEGTKWMAPKNELLTCDDFVAVANAAVSIGIKHIKITGGEPSVRNDLVEIVARIKDLGISDLSLTSNGLLLGKYAKSLYVAGLDRITLSCDSLKPDRYSQITHGGDIKQFWDSVQALHAAGFNKMKLNVVVMAGINDDEIIDFAKLAYEYDWTVRFIEYMPLGDSVITQHNPDYVIMDNADVQKRISDQFGKLKFIGSENEAGVGPAQIYGFDHSQAKGRLGFISAMSQPFCESCNRLRLTAIGELRSCLFDGGEVNLLPALRPESDTRKLVDLFAKCVQMKPNEHSIIGNRAMNQLGG